MIRSTDGLFDDTVFHVLEDDAGQLWGSAAPAACSGWAAIPSASSRRGARPRSRAPSTGWPTE